MTLKSALTFMLLACTIDAAADGVMDKIITPADRDRLAKFDAVRWMR